ncbi:MAG: TetR-like C-terminal domain-containing protein [Lachnospiraceae bacterium]
MGKIIVSASFSDVNGRSENETEREKCITDEQRGAQSDQPNIVAYTTAYFSYGLYGWIEEWFKRGMQEAPKEMAELWEKAQQNEGDAIYSSMLRMASPNS